MCDETTCIGAKDQSEVCPEIVPSYSLLASRSHPLQVLHVLRNDDTFEIFANLAAAASAAGAAAAAATALAAAALHIDHPAPALRWRLNCGEVFVPERGGRWLMTGGRLQAGCDPLSEHVRCCC